MALYRTTGEKLEAVPESTFSALEMFERKHLQQLLRRNIAPLGDDLMVLAEEFGDWEESSRRIDLLCLDKNARLVVVELKRTEDGGHMELQAIRYAAMVSSMTLEQAISAFARNLGGDDPAATARKQVLDFLELDSGDEVELSGEVRIILVSANFSTELTTSVIWLNRHGLDITCVRLKPYKVGENVLIDVTQIIPLPEAADYEIKVRAQEQETRKVRTARQEIFRRFWTQYIERSRARTPLLANRSPTTDHWLTAGIGRAGFHLSTSLTEDRGRVECYIRFGAEMEQRSKEAFRALLQQKAAIEQVFGAELDWQELPTRSGSRICADTPGGWRTPEADWPTLQDALLDKLVRLEAALRGPIQRLTI